MKLKLRFAGSALLGLLWLAASAVAQADPITIDTVPIGNAGNAPDNTGYGAVAYDYRIGTTEVTNAQYVAFLNAKAASDPLGLYRTSMNTDVRGAIALVRASDASPRARCRFSLFFA